MDGVRVRGAQRFQQRERLRQSLGTGLLDTAAQQDNQNADIFAARQQAAGIPDRTPDPGRRGILPKLGQTGMYPLN